MKWLLNGGARIRTQVSLSPRPALENFLLKIGLGKHPFFLSRLWVKSTLPHRSEVLVIQSCPTLCDLMNCSPPGASVQGILQARILEWVAISFSRGSSQTQVSCIASWFFTIWATRQPHRNWPNFNFYCPVTVCQTPLAFTTSLGSHSILLSPL